MIGAMYSSDQRIVEIYKDKSTIAETSESKVSPDDVMNYIQLISVANMGCMNLNNRRLRRAS